LVEERRKGNCMERVVRAAAKSYLVGPHVTGRLAETAETARDRFSVSYLIATAARIIRELANLAARARHSGKRLATLTLETENRFASAASRTAFAEELANTFASLAAKYHNEAAEGGRRFRVVAAAYPATKPDISTHVVNNESVNME